MTITVYVVEGRYHLSLSEAAEDQHLLMETGYNPGPIEVYDLEEGDLLCPRTRRSLDADPARGKP